MAKTRFAEDNQEIRSRFKTLFEAANPTIRVIYENQPEDRGGDPFPEIDEEFVKLMVRLNDSQLVCLGNPRGFRNFGTITILIQTAIGQGTKRNEVIADLAGDVFANITVGGIIYRSPRYFQQGLFRDGWYRGSVSVNYESTYFE